MKLATTSVLLCAIVTACLTLQACKSNSPPAIPPEYQRAFEIVSNLNHVVHVGGDDKLFNIRSVNPTLQLNEILKGFVKETDLRATFEDALTRHGVSIDPNSRFQLVLSFQAGDPAENGGKIVLYGYVLDCSEPQVVVRGEARMMNVSTASLWGFGLAGTNEVRDVFASEIDKMTETFGTSLKRANPK